MATVFLDDAKALIDFCKERGVRRVKLAEFEAEFFESIPSGQDLRPEALAKVLGDNMPPDSAMLFAATEDIKVESST